MDNRRGQHEKPDPNTKDTRRFEAEDNEGHIKGSQLSHFNEQKAREAEDNDKSKLNYWDDRGNVQGTENV